MFYLGLRYIGCTFIQVCLRLTPDAFHADECGCGCYFPFLTIENVPKEYIPGRVERFDTFALNDL
ncbi:hypothetical protein [Odoribacter sp. AF15-53]|uniref:hypothetical protein n=1 Tax=Odoribacter sp. AF15-53 TaxID=2292236 RepID=UPI000E48D5FE|nr:hypothetical protein [Odoribacter sp. AF15-53]RHR75774.1 hypothetical protein DWW52_17520 [Odoribacter sp. AF15-53]